MIATSHSRVPQCFALAASIFTALSMCSVAQTPVKLPKDAQALQTAYHEARQQALLPVERKYREELEKLLAAHTKAGRIDEALAIRTELALLTPEFTAKLLMERPWSYTMASFKTEWKFKPDNTVSSGRWSISGKILRLDFPDSMA